MKKVVISCVKDLMDAYGEDFDADEVGGVVPLDRETIGDDTYELFDRKGVPAAMFGVMEGLLALGTDFR